jgi:hypothetical protein
MGDVIDFAAGNYRFIEGVSQYSGGVAAHSGYRLERVRFAQPLPLAEGFVRIASHIRALGRPITAFAACELRSPAPFSEEGFVTFNKAYTETIKGWGLLDMGHNPIARSNVCPKIAPPSEPSIYAFAYTVADADAAPSFIVSGSAEVPEGHVAYRDHIVRRGDLSPEGLRAKAQFVLAEMERRANLLGFAWKDATAVQVYTVHNLFPFLSEEIVMRGAARAGLTWHFNNPPVIDLEYEMDCRGISTEHVI